MRSSSGAGALTNMDRNTQFPAYVFEPFRFDSRDGLQRDGRSLPLPPKTAELLLALLEAHGHLVTKEELIDKIWPDTFVEESNLTYHIHVLRRALSDGSEGQPHIETVPRRGYRFVAPVTEISSGAVGPTAAVDGDAVGPVGTCPEQAAPRTDLSAEIHAALPDTYRGEMAPPPDVPQTRRSPVTWRLSLAIAAGFGALLALSAGASVLLDRDPPMPRVVRYTQLTNDGMAKVVNSPVLTDGSRLIFDRLNGQSVVTVDRAEPIEPNPFKDVHILDISAVRGEALAVKRNDRGAERAVWRVSLKGAPARRVGEVLADTARWSPDGERIAYVFDRSLYLSDVEGTAIQKLQTFGGRPRWPRWSPDGRVLRFTISVESNRTQTLSLWDINVDGSGLRMVLEGSNRLREVCCGAWMPGGTDFVFQGKSDGPQDLWLLRARKSLLGQAKSELVRLTSGPLSFFGPVPSADGKRIFAFGVDERGELIRYDAGQRQFAPYLGGISAAWVDFSRDGQWVTYVSVPEHALWRARSDGSRARRLTQPPLSVVGSFFSPDGRFIAFRGQFPDKRAKVYVIPAEGGTPEPLTAADVEQGIPSWSPDGTQLAFGDVPETFGQATGTEVIHIYDRALNAYSAVPDSKGFWTSRWSPDGKYLAALTIEGQRLMLFDFAKKRWRSTAAHHVNSPTWSRDSKYIYFDPENTETMLRRARAADGAVERLVDLKDNPPRGYHWAGLSLDNAPILLRYVNAPEIYALELDRP
jgi:Tol biopolymer transport system component/DNA-binding winged helix-turn-helix (wHTH) protein